MMTKTLRLVLVNDANLCNGTLACCAAAPDLLEIAEHGDEEWTVSIRGESIEVPPHLREQAEAAASLCPEEAYTLVEVEG